ncbi:MAG: YitT family protein [Lachnospiraceae bacterium]|nr:YitT family protein [Lachnospiraceae bacterium]
MKTRKTNRKVKFLKKPVWIEYLFIIIGTAIMAVAIGSVYSAVNLVTGGFTGIAIIVKGVSEQISGFAIPLWFTNLLLNIPLFVSAAYMKGFKFLKKTMIATFLLSGWLYVIPEIEFIENDLFLTAVFGGILSGIGLGMVLMVGSTTGGVDLLATLICTKFRNYSIVHVMQVVDAVIILVGAFIFGFNLALYAIVAIFIVTQVSDALIEGAKFAKVVFIITSKPEEISFEIMKNLNRGVTGIEAEGMYSKKQRQMLFCVVSKKEIVAIKDLIQEIDSNAFVIVSEAREVLGEGFLKHQIV